jgi:type I restriction enzyme S subunit
VEHLEDNRITKKNLPRVKPEDKERLSKYLLQEGDIVFSRVGSVDRRALVRIEEDGWMFSGRCLRVRPNPHRINPCYLSWFFGLPAFQEHVRQIAVGATMPSLNTTIMSELDIFYPDLPEQRAIAHILGTLDDKIELNRRMNETLEAMARALFKSWFVDFDPVRAKAEGRETGLPKHIADLFADRFQESELGEMPEGWSLQTIGSLSDLNALSLRKNDKIDRIEYIEISEVSRGNIGSVQTFERGAEPSRARRRLRNGDTVLSTVRPDRGSYFLCLNPTPNLIASTGFAVLTPTRAPWSFVHAAMTQEAVFEYLGLRADGGAYPAVRPEIIGQWLAPWPKEEGIPKEFHCACSSFYERAAQNRCESNTLAAIRDALLPKLLSGEIRVNDAERFLGDAV